MMPSLMPVAQQSSLPVQPLPARTARRVSPAACDRWLWVAQGRIWITGVPTEARGADVWLSAGEAVRVPAGAEAVLESGSRAEDAAFLLVEAAEAADTPATPGTRARPGFGPQWPGWARTLGAGPLLRLHAAR